MGNQVKGLLDRLLTGGKDPQEVAICAKSLVALASSQASMHCFCLHGPALLWLSFKQHAHQQLFHPRLGRGAVASNAEKWQSPCKCDPLWMSQVGLPLVFSSSARVLPHLANQVLAESLPGLKVVLSPISQPSDHPEWGLDWILYWDGSTL
eukprot:1136215-Pelagomonas_calceolata.AAC.3